MAAALTLEELPIDAWPAIARCLTGSSLFDLARVSRWSWRLFSQDVFWRERLTSEDAIDQDDDDEATSSTTALQLYMRAFSFQFQGLYRDHRMTRGSCAEAPSFYSDFVRQRTPFAFDIWFCLLDQGGGGDNDGDGVNDMTNAVYAGGVLLGAQSVAYEDRHWADYHQQFAVVSSDRKLYCTVVNERPVIADDLEFNRWYHLALTYGTRTQKVYLDGQLKSTVDETELHDEWRHWHFAQVGTGCITAGDMDFPEPQRCGWYPFNGLIDSFRLWRRVLSSEDIRALAQGNAEQVQGDPHYSLRTNLLYHPPKHTIRVGCSRPKEKIVEFLSRGSSKPTTSKSDSSQPKQSAASRGDRNQWQQSRRANPRRGGGASRFRR